MKTSPASSVARSFLRGKSRLAALAILLGAGVTGQVSAATDTWNGGVSSGSWTVAGNWGGGAGPAPSANDSLVFAGTGTANTNSFAAGTNFDGITFSSTAGTFTLSGNAIDLTGNITNNSASAETVGLGLVLQGTSTITTASNTTAAASTSISGNISGSGPLVIVGSNVLGSEASGGQTAAATSFSLSGSNSYTGSTTFTGGNVTLNYSLSTAPKLSGSTLTLGGFAGGVALTTSGTGTETVSSTVIAAGNSSLAPTSVINLGTVSGTDGGVLTLATKSATQVVNYTGTITATSNVGGILGGFAIFSGNTNNTDANWVASTGTTGSPSTLSIFTGYNTSTTTSSWAGTNVSMAAAQNSTLASTSTINSLKFAGAGATLNLSGTNVITTGGILSPTGYGGTITGGSITSGGADLYVFASSSSGTVTIASNIVGNIGITMDPTSSNSAATLLLTGSANTFTGNIAITRGTLSLGSALPTNTGDTITLNAVVASSVHTTLQDVETTGTLTVNAANYQIVGNGDVTKSNQTGNTLALLGAHAYTGITTDSGGVLQIDTLANGGSNSSIGASSNAAANLVLSGVSTLQYVGSGGSTDHLFTIFGSTATVTLDGSGTGAANYTNAGPVAFSSATSTANFILTGTNKGANTLAEALGNDGTGTTTVSKTGVGTWVVTGSNSYSGGTTISGGTLYANGAAGSGYSALGSGNVSVASGGTLAGNGSLAPNAGNLLTVSAGGSLTPGGVQTTVPFTGTPGTTANGSLTVTPASTGTIVSITSANLTFALGAGGATSGSQLIIGGSSANTVLFSGTSTVTINDLVGANLTLNREYELIDGNSSTTFSGLTMAGSTTGTLGYQITGGLQLLAANTAGNFYSQWYNSSQLFYNPTTDSIDIEVVPEPSTWALMAGGLGLLVFWQRRQRRS